MGAPRRKLFIQVTQHKIGPPPAEEHEINYCFVSSDNSTKVSSWYYIKELSSYGFSRKHKNKIRKTLQF
jgi:hypothetical protein